MDIGHEGAEAVDMHDLKIFLPGEFIEADRKRKEAETKEPILLVETKSEPVSEPTKPSVTLRRGPGPDPEDMKRHATDIHDAPLRSKIAALGSRVTETEA